MNFVDYLEIEYIKDKDGEILTRIPIKNYCLNINNIVHGGVIMTLIDTACGKKASEIFGEVEIVTTEGYTNFLRPAHDTAYLYAKCNVRKKGRHIVNIDCDVFDDNCKLISIGRFSFFKPN
ncbi:PaaI family thioesterase [Anaerococcus sp. AGMB00486]|uniref:PaaI family thioesterase n=1 Tax=Anaerococcus faecalis TaxID=2742993 RepID=A0ABX2N8J4_9FIRM|nr:PaaI family thioesterase [Anaerococcus faecalis]NVF10989.1 PaaI family thioesterase [Anaerococcus faecalis]